MEIEAEEWMADVGFDSPGNTSDGAIFLRESWLLFPSDSMRNLFSKTRTVNCAWLTMLHGFTWKSWKDFPSGHRIFLKRIPP